VLVVVALAGLPQVGVPIRATVVLDTHTVALDDVVFARAVALRTPEGAEVAPTRVEGLKGSGHHRQAVCSELRRGGRSEMAKDPVCGMTVDEKKAAATASFQGQTYYFCSAGCKATFEQAPAKYVGARA
jgi:YHS domain-containing protein